MFVVLRCYVWSTLLRNNGNLVVLRECWRKGFLSFLRGGDGALGGEDICLNSCKQVFPAGPITIHHLIFGDAVIKGDNVL